MRPTKPMPFALIASALGSLGSMGVLSPSRLRDSVRPHGHVGKPFRGRVIGYAPISPPDKSVESKFRDDQKAARRKRKRFGYPELSVETGPPAEWPAGYSNVET